MAAPEKPRTVGLRMRGPADVAPGDVVAGGRTLPQDLTLADILSASTANPPAGALAAAPVAPGGVSGAAAVPPTSPAAPGAASPFSAVPYTMGAGGMAGPNPPIYTQANLAGLFGRR